MYLEINGGLTGRLIVMATAMASRHYPENIKLVWKQSPGINAAFSDLYSTSIEFVDVDKSDLHIVNADQYGDNNVRLEPGNPKFDNYYVTSDWPMKFDGEDVNWNRTYEILRSLQPTEEIQTIVNRYSQSIEDSFGLQIRRGIGVNYNINTNIFSPTELIIKTIRDVLDKNPSQKFFVATDSYYELERMCINFENNITCVREYQDYPIDSGYTLPGLKRAVADFYLLSKTKAIYTTECSGFAKRIADIYGLPLHVIKEVNQHLMSYHQRNIGNKHKGIF